MTNAELIAKIKAEIERLKDENRKIKCQANERYCSGYDDAFYDLVPFLDTLESEKPMQDGLEEEIDKYREEHLFDMPAFQQVARHFAEWGAEHAKIDVTDFCKPIDPGIAQCIADHSWEMLGEDEKPVPTDLEEAAEKHSADFDSTIWYVLESSNQKTIWKIEHKETFIAGAKWQKEQAEKDIIAIVKEYVEKGFRCMEQSDKFQMHTFWDGFHNCAENILRELEEKK